MKEVHWFIDLLDMDIHPYINLFKHLICKRTINGIYSVFPLFDHMMVTDTEFGEVRNWLVINTEIGCAEEIKYIIKHIMLAQ